MARALNVAPEVASVLPASHLAQLSSDVDAEDNVCVACAAVIDGPAAELVVLHDSGAMLARLAHPSCVASGVYEWEGTSAAVAALTLRPDGVDVATALVWRTTPARPRAIVLVEPRIHISLDDDGAADPLERLFAAPLGLSAVSDPVETMTPAAAVAPGCRIVARETGPGGGSGAGSAVGAGLRIESDAGLRVSVPARPELVARWRSYADDGRAIVIVGRGLGITRPEAELLPTLSEALRLRPCWAATVAVTG